MVKSSKRLNPIILCLFMLVIAFGITSFSSSLVHTIYSFSYDSFAYRYMGMLMAKGGVPYVDAFDNKGPVLYIIEYLGYIINRHYGIFLMELIFVLSFLLIQFCICSKFLPYKWSVICTLVSVSPLSFTFVGNMCEEYSLLFIAIGLYYFIDYFVFHKANWYGLVLCGFSFGVVLLIRPNMVVMWAVMCLAVIIKEIANNHSFPVKYLFLFTMGFLLIFIPVLVWLSCNGAVEECFKDYILSNFKYINHDNSSTQVLKALWGFFINTGMPAYVSSLVFMMIFEKKADNNLFFHLFYVICLILTVCSLSIKGVLYLNYAMIVTPLYAYPISVFFRFLLKKNNKKINIICFLSCIAACLPLISFMFCNTINFSRSYMRGNPYPAYEQKVLDYIEMNTGVEDRILVLGYKCLYYVESDRLCSTKFYYQLNDNVTYPDGVETVISDINAELPKIIIVEGGVDWEGLFRYYDRYDLVNGYPGIWKLRE